MIIPPSLSERLEAASALSGNPELSTQLSQSQVADPETFASDASGRLPPSTADCPTSTEQSSSPSYPKGCGPLLPEHRTRHHWKPFRRRWRKDTDLTDD